MRLALHQPSVASRLAQRARMDMTKNNSYDRIGRRGVLGLKGKLVNVQDDSEDARST